MSQDRILDASRKDRNGTEDNSFIKFSRMDLLSASSIDKLTTCSVQEELFGSELCVFFHKLVIYHRRITRVQADGKRRTEDSLDASSDGNEKSAEKDSIDPAAAEGEISENGDNNEELELEGDEIVEEDEEEEEALNSLFQEVKQEMAEEGELPESSDDEAEEAIASSPLRSSSHLDVEKMSSSAQRRVRVTAPAADSPPAHPPIGFPVPHESSRIQMRPSPGIQVDVSFEARRECVLAAAVQNVTDCGREMNAIKDFMCAHRIGTTSECVLTRETVAAEGMSWRLLQGDISRMLFEVGECDRVLSHCKSGQLRRLCAEARATLACLLEKLKTTLSWTEERVEEREEAAYLPSFLPSIESPVPAQDSASPKPIWTRVGRDPSVARPSKSSPRVAGAAGAGCSFCGSRSHSSAKCHTYPTIGMREVRRRELRLCSQCLNPFNASTCSPEAHRQLCSICRQHYAHAALCDHSPHRSVASMKRSDHSQLRKRPHISRAPSKY